jgi:hypothetical protein
MKNTTAILYHGGTYGTYLDWLLNTLIHDLPVVPPFKKHGTSHGWQGHHVKNIDGWRRYMQNDAEFGFVRCHPKTDQGHVLSNNINEILNGCKRAIFIYPSRDHELLCLNNFMVKPWSTSNMFDGPLRSIRNQDLYRFWPVVQGTALNDIPRWIVREFLSFYLVPAWRDQVEWYFPMHWKHPRCLVIYTREIFDDIQLVVDKIKNFAGFKYQKNINDLMQYHDQMLRLQTWSNEDHSVNQIVTSLIDPTSEPRSWNPLSITSESYIQWKLRQLGYLLQCNELDEFPTDTVELKLLLYKNEQYVDKS